MILFYGPAGSGKTTQAQLLAKRLKREWLSAGEIIRNSGKFDDFTSKGAMIDERILVELISGAVKTVRQQGKDVVFDGQPGVPEQVGYWKEAGLLDMVEAVIVLEVPQEESIKRLSSRGRHDDNMEVWRGKFRHYEQKIYSFLTPIKAANIPVFYVDGVGSIEAVSDRIDDKIAKVVRPDLGV